VPPTITTPPIDIAVRLGHSASFTCIGTGSPTPRIQWFLGIKVIGEGSTLNFTDVKASNAATYTCIASNEAGNEASKSARLVIYGKV